MPNPIETAAAKVVGKTAAVEARVKGLKGVFTKLAEQHHEVGVLLSRAERATDYTKRADLWRQIRKQLVSHEQAELVAIYPALESSLGASEIASAHAAHASDLEALIAEVDRIGVQSDDWERALGRLSAAVKDHVELEENEYFPRAQEALGPEAARGLEAPFLRAQEMAAAKLG